MTRKERNVVMAIVAFLAGSSIFLAILSGPAEIVSGPPGIAPETSHD